MLFFGGRHMAMPTMFQNQQIAVLPWNVVCNACSGTCVSDGTLCRKCKGEGQLRLKDKQRTKTRP